MVGLSPGKSFSVAELKAAGVRRISLASSLYRAAMGGLVAAAREVKDRGTFGYVGTAMPSAELAGSMRETASVSTSRCCVARDYEIVAPQRYWTLVQ
jgi:2-methylisocitrate lyase-like PEP mutase family enzyme